MVTTFPKKISESTIILIIDPHNILIMLQLIKNKSDNVLKLFKTQNNTIIECIMSIMSVS